MGNLLFLILFASTQLIVLTLCGIFMLSCYVYFDNKLYEVNCIILLMTKFASIKVRSLKLPWVKRLTSESNST